MMTPGWEHVRLELGSTYTPKPRFTAWRHPAFWLGVSIGALIAVAVRAIVG